MVSPVLSSTQHHLPSPSFSLSSTDPCSYQDQKFFEILLDIETTLESLADQLRGYLRILEETIEYYFEDPNIEDLIWIYDEMKEWVDHPQMLGGSIYRTFKYWEFLIDDLKTEEGSDAADDLPPLCARELSIDFSLEGRVTLRSAKQALREYRLIVLKKMSFFQGVEIDLAIPYFCSLLGQWVEKETREDQNPIDALYFWAKRVQRIRESLNRENLIFLPEIVFS